MTPGIPGLWLVDTNVVVASLLSGNPATPPARIVDAMLDGRMHCLVSVELLAEYRSVLLRERIRTRHGLDDDEIDSLLTAIATHANVVDITAQRESAPDAGDDHLWRMLAAAGNARLITGDRLLLENPPENTSIYSVREWCERHMRD